MHRPLVCVSLVSALLALPATLLSAGGPAMAQSGATEKSGEKTDWRLTIGAGAMLAPSYLGSDDYDIDALPLFDLRYADRVFLSTRDGLGANLLSSSRWRAGPVIKYRFGRDQDDDDALRGLGDVDPAGEAGGFVHYDLRPFKLGAEIRQGFGGHEAVIGDMFVTWSTRLTDSLMLTAGPRATVASKDFTQTYFGIDAGQAARSGYRPYDPDGAYVSYGLGATLTYKLTDQLSLGGFAGIDRIAGDAADSPIVDQAGSATQARLGLTLGYSWGW
ncbi:MipA/OmpV family protein [Ferrovibrio sp.]|uniref:MipA/OmpV family protein n=1 Tax=Ferrovibrio sp. TaxID=1917215 RepID=UPI0026290FC2|nr:MipA/OmpV family protein [Ferrovibrio sp.]